MTFDAARPLTALALLAALAACSGDGDGDGFPTLFERQVAEGDAILDAANDEEFTPEEALPTGTAEYNGVIVLADESDETYGLAGDLTLTADFAGLDLGGQITNVADSEGQSYGGTLDVGEDYDDVSGINPSANPGTQDVFSANFGGTLTAGLDSWDVDGSLGGDFRGPNGEYAVGTAAADVCLTGTLDCTPFSGILAAD